MAESESGQDKTEEPTEKRKRTAREKGEIARSRVACWRLVGIWLRPCWP